MFFVGLFFFSFFPPHSGPQKLTSSNEREKMLMLYSSGKQTNLLKITVEKCSSLIGYIYSLETLCKFLNSSEAVVNVFHLYNNVLRNHR